MIVTIIRGRTTELSSQGHSFAKGLISMRRLLLPLLAFAALLASDSVSAQQISYDALFPNGRSYDFGTVARGSRVRHTFVIRNTTAYDIHIADTRTKCGCTDVKVGARDIPPGTQTTIEATVDTTKFQGYKASGLVLVLNRPQFIELDLNLTCFIRSDVTLNPGGADFQLVPRGSSPSLTLNLTAVRPGWEIVKVHTVGDAVKAEARKLVQSAGAPSQYQIVVTLDKSAPSGYFRDEITLFTNDANSPRIPVSVTANIQSAVSVAPAIVNLGRIKPGQEVKKVVLVKASKPFKVTGVKGMKPELSATNAFEDAKTFHNLTVTLKAPTQPGPYNATLEIATDIENEPPAKLVTFATIVP